MADNRSTSIGQQAIQTVKKPIQKGYALLKSVLKVWHMSGFRGVMKGTYYKLADVYAHLHLNGLIRFPARYADVYIPVDNSQVVLYTDFENRFQDYPYRRELSGHERKGPVRTSLIATVYNEEERVADWMESILQQSVMPDEIVIVDAQSTDGTLTRLRSYRDRSPVPLRIIAEGQVNIARGRNIAIEQARHPIIVGTDFGCRPQEDWFEKIITPFRVEPQTEVVGGFYRPVDEAGRFLNSKNVPKLDQVVPQTFIPSSRSIAFRKSAWEEVGGYPEWLTLTGEDTYFALELKRYCTHWAFVPDAVVEWMEPGSMWNQLKKAYSWSSGNGELGYNAWLYRGSIKHILGVMLAWFLGAGLILLSFLVSEPGGSWLFWLIGSAGLFFALGPILYYGFNGQPPWHIPGDLALRAAQVLGFAAGVKRREEVTRRRLNDSRGVFFILAGVPIDDTGGGARCTQISLELLRRGYWVVYINQFPKWESKDAGVRITHPNLNLYELENFEWEAFQDKYGTVLSVLDMYTLVEFPTPEFLQLSEEIKEHDGFVIYELIDDWDSDLGGDWYASETEQKLIEISQGLVGTAPSLKKRLERASDRDVLFLPNAVNRFLFDPDVRSARPEDYPPGEWSAIYIGALWGSWFDWDLLTSLARSYPRAAVVVIGDYTGQCPDPPPNLHFLGLKPQTALPAYLAEADVALIPWKVNDITQATSPLKLYEYLAMHTPVVTPDLNPLQGIPGVVRAENSAGFIQAVGRVREEEFPEREVETFIHNNDWKARVESLLDYVETMKTT